MIRRPPRSTLFPYTRSSDLAHRLAPLVPLPLAPADRGEALAWTSATTPTHQTAIRFRFKYRDRSEEHTSELQSLAYLVCRLLLEKKNKTIRQTMSCIPTHH